MKGQPLSGILELLRLCPRSGHAVAGTIAEHSSNLPICLITGMMNRYRGMERNHQPPTLFRAHAFWKETRWHGRNY